MIDENDPRLMHLSEDLRRRIAQHAHDDAGCLIWHGPYCGKTPALYLPAAQNPTGKRGYTTARSKILREIAPALAGRRDLATWVRCEDSRCVHPEHVYAVGRNRIAKHASDAGYTSDPMRRAAIARKRQSQSTLTWDDILAIRASTEKQYIVAEQFGISRSGVSAIKRNKVWRQRPGAASWADVFMRLAA
jgi:hypothetical protein